MALVCAVEVGAQKILYLARTIQLVEQTRDEAAAYFQSSTYVTGRHKDWTGQFVACTYDSVNVSKIRPDLVIFDEAHRSIPYKDMINVLMGNTNCLLLGLTATPDRSDGVPLGRVYDKVVWTRGAEAYQAPLVEKKEAVKSFKDVYRVWHKHTQGRVKTICYVKNTDIAYNLAQYFRACGVKAAAVSCQTPHQQREDIQHEAVIIFNVDIYTEGSDLPGVGCIFDLSPTRWWGRQIQRKGRGLRPDTPRCLYICGYGNILKVPKVKPLRKKRSWLARLFGR